MKVSLRGLSGLGVVAVFIFTCTVPSVTGVRGENVVDKIKRIVNSWTEIIFGKIFTEEINEMSSDWQSTLLSTIENFKTPPSLVEIGEFIDAAIEEDCYQEDCPLGYVKQANVDYTSESNGCGSFGIQWKRDLMPDEGLEDCCNEHDFCYDTCGADRDVCDLNFKTCLYRTCANPKKQRTTLEVKVCKGAAKFMYTTTQALGCKAYQEAQKKACVCVKEFRSHKEF